MANRPVFETTDHSPFFRKTNIDFMFYNGFSIQQKQRCIRSLHETYTKVSGNDKVLEISSKSEVPCGVALSAFNLSMTASDGNVLSVESLFQGSKVFEKGGPYNDIYFKSSSEAHKDNRIRESGKVIGFRYYDKDFPITPNTFFFNWLYINVLHQNQELEDKLMKYNAFTDIEFNPQRQINCQAEAAAIYVGLKKRGVLEEALENKDCFRRIVYGF